MIDFLSPSWHDEQTAAVGLTLTSLVGSVSIVTAPLALMLFVSNVDPSTSGLSGSSNVPLVRLSMWHVTQFLNSPGNLTNVLASKTV